MRHANAYGYFDIRDKFLCALDRDIEAISLKIIDKFTHRPLCIVAAVPDAKLVKLHSVNVGVHLIGIDAKLKRRCK